MPKKHVKDFTSDPETSAETIKFASKLAKKIKSCNLITSKGAEATQSISHLHLHIVPRKKGDKLKLPWSERKEFKGS